MGYKSVVGEVKDVDISSKTVTGYFSTFWVLDSDSEMVLPGAFKKTIKERGVNGSNRIMHLYQHDTWQILGKPKLLKEDKKGLYFETEMNGKRELVADVLQMYADGTLNEHSIGYRVLQSKDVVDSNGKRIHTELQELMLWEGSTVTWAANENTPFTGFKSKDKPEQIEELKEKMERFSDALRKGKYTDDTMHLIEIEVAQLTELIKSLEASEPIIEVTPDDEPIDLTGIVESFKKTLTNGKRRI